MSSRRSRSPSPKVPSKKDGGKKKSKTGDKPQTSAPADGTTPGEKAPARAYTAAAAVNTAAVGTLRLALQCWELTMVAGHA